jgi:Family of unknown function (DUF5764)
MENSINFDYSIPCFGKAIVDAKDIYTDYLIDTLAPLIYEGIYKVYTLAQDYHKKADKKEKRDADFKNPGLIHFFRLLLQKLKDMNNTNIENEASRIKNQSGCAEIFDDLIKAVIKSHISVLTCTVKESKLIKETKFHENIDINLFIHKCYIESIKFIYNMPQELLEHTQENQQTMLYHIKKGIKNAIIREILPMRQILDEYLSNNYEEIIESHNEKLKAMVLDALRQEQKREKEIQAVNMLEESDAKLNTFNEDYEFDLNKFLIKEKENAIMSERPNFLSDRKQEIKTEIKSEVKPEIRTEIKSEEKKEEVKPEENKEENNISEKKPTIDAYELFNSTKGKKVTDEMMFDEIKKMQNKMKLDDEKSHEVNINNDNNSAIKDIKIDKKIIEADNAFYEE